MPNTPEAAYAMLACTRIGAMHSVIFAGFSVEAIRSRIIDAKSRVVITATSVKRGGKSIPLKRSVDEALEQCPEVTKVFVWKREGDDCSMTDGRYFFFIFIFIVFHLYHSISLYFKFSF